MYRTLWPDGQYNLGIIFLLVYDYKVQGWYLRWD